MSESGSGEGSRLAGLAAGAKKALIAFVVFDALFVAGALALYLGVFRPQQLEIERARDRALRANVALETRLHALEARAALRVGDFTAAREAVRGASDRLADLVRAVPHDAAVEMKEVGDIASRLELVRSEIDRDAETARRDLELVEARLGALYPTRAPVAR